MEELLNKLYEYFIKRDFQDQESDDMYDLYEMIINKYDVSKDEQMRIDMNEFFKFFCTLSFGVRLGSYYSIYGCVDEKVSRKRFEHSKASFDWFKASKYMVSNLNFVYSVTFERKYFCKAYLSIKPEKYLSVILKLHDYIDKFYANHSHEAIGECKFRKFPANDAIVMRFSCEEHYNEFLQYLDQNRDIMEAFDTPNPFLPQDEYGLSLIVDNGGSYNNFVTRMIWCYMFDCKNKNVNVSVSGLVEFINNYDCSKDWKICDNDEIISSFKKILCGKLLSRPNDELLSMIIKPKAKTLKLVNEQ